MVPSVFIIVLSSGLAQSPTTSGWAGPKNVLSEPLGPILQKELNQDPALLRWKSTTTSPRAFMASPGQKSKTPELLAPVSCLRRDAVSFPEASDPTAMSM